MSSILNSAFKNLRIRRHSSGGIDTKMRFSVEPYPGDSGFNQWRDAMKMVARLPGGIPIEFRKRLWLNLAERHVQYRKINWPATYRVCFNDKTNPDDEALGVQIVKDLHRTGCSLFSGEESEHNQALLKQVLLAYARWNKTVGYCQGFNMLAAIILEVMERQVEDSLKVMIFLIEGVLPESYFANNLRGLSVDMAVFRDLLRMRLPGLSRHLDRLQSEAQDGATGTSYEPPLINVFTMQWFLTLFSNCLPKSSVLRVWDLIFLEGNEVLLRTALAIWDGLADRIMTVESADEFYSIMGVLTREMMEFGLMDTNQLIKTICTMAPFPFPQLADLREKYTFNIRPLTTSSFTLVKRGFQIFHSDDEEDNDHDDQLVMATWCLSNAFSLTRNKGDGGSTTPSPSTSTMTFANTSAGGGGEANYLSPSCNNVDPQRMTLDISLLKKQYAKLRERQKQAHIILTGGFHQSPSTVTKSSVAVNHLLIGKKPLVRKNRRQSVTAPSTPVQPPRDSFLKVPRTNERGEVQKQSTTSMPDSGRRDSGETLSWADVKSERKKQRLATKLSDPSLPRLSEVTNVESVPTEFQNIEKGESDSDTSSSSTELCDDISADDLSDYLSSPEPRQKARTPKGSPSTPVPGFETNLSLSKDMHYNDSNSAVPFTSSSSVPDIISAKFTKDLASPSDKNDDHSSSSSTDSEPRYDDEMTKLGDNDTDIKLESDVLTKSLASPEPKTYNRSNSSSSTESEPKYAKGLDMKQDSDKDDKLDSKKFTKGLTSPKHNEHSSIDALRIKPKYKEFETPHESYRDDRVDPDKEPRDAVQSDNFLPSSVHSISPLDSPIRYSWEDDNEYESMKSRIFSDIMGDLSTGSLESVLRISTGSKGKDSAGVATDTPSMLHSASASYLDTNLDEKLEILDSKISEALSIDRWDLSSVSSETEKVDVGKSEIMMATDDGNISHCHDESEAAHAMQGETKGIRSTSESFVQSNAKNMHAKVQKSFSDNMAIMPQKDDHKTEHKTANGLGYVSDSYRTINSEIHSGQRHPKDHTSAPTKSSKEENLSECGRRSSSGFNPFPTTRRQSRTNSVSEVGVRLGLYSPSPDNKRISDKDNMNRSSASSQQR